MKKTALILALIASTAAIAAAPAQAGPRLQFGGPLGSFEATPYAKGSNYGHNSYSSKRSSHGAAQAAAQRAAAKKAYARKLAAQKAAKEAAARKYAAQKAAQQKIAAQKAAEQATAAKRAAAQKIAAKKATAAKRDKVEEKPVETAATTEDASKRAPVKASAIAGTNTLDFDRNVAENTDVAALAKTEPAKVEAVEEKAELECKKYIPSAGLTITVPCGS